MSIPQQQAIAAGWAPNPGQAAPLVVTLAVLGLSSAAASAGSAYSATVTNKSVGSTVTATSSDGTALTVVGAAISGTFAAVGTPVVTLTETLAGAPNSPKVTFVNMTVALAAPTPNLDLNFATQAYILPNAVQPFAAQIDYSDSYNENADGSLVKHLNYELRTTTLGMYCEWSEQNDLLFARDLTNAAWVKSNATAAKTLTGRYAGANGASLVTFTANNGTVIQSLTASSAARTARADLWRVAGTGAVSMTTDGGSTWTVVPVTATKTRFTIPAQTLANPAVGFKGATSGDQIGVDFVESVTGVYEGSPILTTSAAVKRWENRFSAFRNTSSGMHTIMDTTTWSMIIEWTQRNPIGNVLTGASGVMLGGGNGPMTFYSNAKQSGGQAVTTANSPGMATTLQGDVVNRVACRLTGGVASICLNGGAVANSAAGALPLDATCDHIDLLTNGAGNARCEGIVKRFWLYNGALTDAQMVGYSTTGAP